MAHLLESGRRGPGDGPRVGPRRAIGRTRRGPARRGRRRSGRGRRPAGHVPPPPPPAREPARPRPGVRRRHRAGAQGMGGRLDHPGDRPRRRAAQLLPGIPGLRGGGAAEASASTDGQGRAGRRRADLAREHDRAGRRGPAVGGQREPRPGERPARSAGPSGAHGVVRGTQLATRQPRAGERPGAAAGWGRGRIRPPLRHGSDAPVRPAPRASSRTDGRSTAEAGPFITDPDGSGRRGDRGLPG